MYRTVEEQRRHLLLCLDLGYGTLAWSAALLVLLRVRPVSQLAIAAAFTAILLAVTIALNRPLGPHRPRLFVLLLVLGPLGVIELSRRTRGWRPILTVRPDARRD